MPALTGPAFAQALSRALGFGPSKDPLEHKLARIAPLDALADLPHGSPVWIRADLDVEDRDGVIGDDPRLAGLHDTLEFGRAHGWRMLLLGHRGRKPEQTLEFVHQKLRATEAKAGPFVRDWFDERAGTLSGTATAAVRGLAPGSFLVFENLRRYGFETKAWKTTPEEVAPLADELARLAHAFRAASTVYVNDAVAASNKDFSSAALPLAMDRVALGTFTRKELADHVVRAREAGLVSFSGLKLDKLGDLHGIVKRGRVEMVVAGGNLAMALRKADGKRRGIEVSIGGAEDPARAAEKTYVPPEAIEKAGRLLEDAEKHRVKVVLPVDFVLDDGTVANDVPKGRLQCDVGPRTRAHFEAETLAWAKTTRRKVAFHNGVLGKFEEKPYAGGTEAMVGTLRRLQTAGVAVYVGGGEGRAALERYGKLGDVTHAFTAGGTILKCLADKALPFIEALWEQSKPA
ncbi:MAG: phosphoglycerate kinase [Planctomycetes bacterium]|nr:phosphoglycerate kinase [Planctomycetota bacterium]